MKRRTVVAVVACAALLVALAVIAVESRLPSPSLPAAGHAAVGGPGPMRAEKPGVAAVAEHGAFSKAQARAYALLGRIADGELVGLPDDLDADTRAACAPMRALLDHQRVIVGQHRPTRTPGGTFAIAPRPMRASAGADAAGAVSTTGAVVRESAPGAAPAAPGGAAPQAVAAAQVASDLDFVAQPGAIVQDGDEQRITGAGVWAALTLKPGAGLPARIVDSGEGGYAIALYGSDFGSIRVDGGLVVPGRFYRITGHTEITGMAPVNVHVRPLSAVPDFSETPALAPSADG